MKYIKMFEHLLKNKSDVEEYFYDFTDSGWIINISPITRNTEWAKNRYSEDAYYITLNFSAETPPDRNLITKKTEETIPILEETVLRLVNDGNKMGRINLGITIRRNGISCDRDYDFKLENDELAKIKSFDLERFYRESIDHWKCDEWGLSILVAMNY